MHGGEEQQQSPPPAHDRDCDDPAACIADLFAEEGRDDAAMRYTRRQALRYVRSVEDRLGWTIKACQGCAMGFTHEEIVCLKSIVKRTLDCREARQKLLMQIAGWGAVSAAAAVLLMLALGFVPAVQRLLAP
jgi:hypothetical protein